MISWIWYECIRKFFLKISFERNVSSHIKMFFLRMITTWARLIKKNWDLKHFLHIKGARCLSPEINSSNNLWKRKKWIQSFYPFYGQTIAMDKSILRNILSPFQNRIQSQAFCRDNVISKVLKKLSLVESLSNQNMGL